MNTSLSPKNLLNKLTVVQGKPYSGKTFYVDFLAKKLRTVVDQTIVFCGNSCDVEFYSGKLPDIFIHEYFSKDIGKKVNDILKRQIAYKEKKLKSNLLILVDIDRDYELKNFKDIFDTYEEEKNKNLNITTLVTCYKEKDLHLEDIERNIFDTEKDRLSMEDIVKNQKFTYTSSLPEFDYTKTHSRSTFLFPVQKHT